MSTLQPHEPDPCEEVLVSPRYLAGLGVSGEASFAPVAHWPRHDLGDSPCQLLVTSPDHRIRIGWFGDDWDIWRFTASPESIGAPRWAASLNHLTAPEIVAGLTAALARDYAESNTHEDDARFLERPSMYWRSALQPLLDAGWRQGGRGTGRSRDHRSRRTGRCPARPAVHQRERKDCDLVVRSARMGHARRGGLHCRHPVPPDRRNSRRHDDHRARRT
ncbi:DUF317 domain-containing protein [Streptomyces sp. NPDC013181]|uniref:DUF317 domain-containing protein n=1 Tax=Streptomyces sp. NPDC013181 TaxID=3364864 RepID=UPI0036D16CD6